MRRSSKIATAMPSSSGSDCNQMTTKAAAVSGGGGVRSPPLLPDEMIMEVLLRLPVKPILRFRAGCRSWAALLSTEEFCNLHMATAAKAAPPQKLLFVSPAAARSTEVYSRCCSRRTSGSAPNAEDELLFTLDSACGNSMQVLTPASCRGLSLLYDAVAPAYYVCNASTRKVTRLPLSADAYSYSSTGLGFDARTRRHKVVRLLESFHGQEMIIKCEVYAHGGGHGDRRWRPPTGGDVPLGLRMCASSALVNSAINNVQAVFSKGFLHWAVNPSCFLGTPSASAAAVVSFSLAQETLSSIRLPVSWVSHPPQLFLLCEHLVDMDNQLCMVRDVRSYPYGGCALEIWELPDCGSSSGAWSMKHRIDLPGFLVARDLSRPQFVRVVGSTSNGSSGKKVVITIATSIYTYDLCSQALETILSVTDQTHTSMAPSSRFSLFEESLASYGA